MNIENLCQFNAAQFLQLFGLFVQQRRQSFNLTLEDIAVSGEYLSALTLEKIESGKHFLTNEELLTLSDKLVLDEAEILNLARITQVQSLVEVSREINEHFPR